MIFLTDCVRTYVVEKPSGFGSSILVTKKGGNPLEEERGLWGLGFPLVIRTCSFGFHPSTFLRLDQTD